MKKTLLIFSALLFAASVAFAQENATPVKTEPARSVPAKASEPADEEHKAAESHAAAAEGAEGKKEEAEVDPHAQFTQSPSVKWIARTLGVETKNAYWISVVFNFAILAFAIIWLSRTGVPQMFKNRTAAIQKGMEEARKASAESAARLAEIEGRLSKLDSEIANMRTQAESEAQAEEERLRAATEDEKRKIVQSAEQEIAAAANSARRELKNLAAELAVSLAEKNIKVSDDTDKVLVRDFAGNLDGKGRS